MYTNLNWNQSATSYNNVIPTYQVVSDADAKSNGSSSMPRWHIGSACSYISPGGTLPGNMGAIIGGNLQNQTIEIKQYPSHRINQVGSDGKISGQDGGSGGGFNSGTQKGSGNDKSTSGGAGAGGILNQKNSSLSQ